MRRQCCRTTDPRHARARGPTYTISSGTLRRVNAPSACCSRGSCSWSCCYSWRPSCCCCMLFTKGMISFQFFFGIIRHLWCSGSIQPSVERLFINGTVADGRQPQHAVRMFVRPPKRNVGQPIIIQQIFGFRIGEFVHIIHQ